jgi:hypothetical protein
MFELYDEYEKLGFEINRYIYDLFSFDNYLILSKAIKEKRELTEEEFSQMKFQEWAGEILESERLEKERMEMQ